jgi:arabinonate dehydratase
MSATRTKTIRLDANDNLVVALDALKTGEDAGLEATAAADIPAGHKMATAFIKDGAPIFKFNQIIGFAAGDIRPGEHIHTHNCDFKGFERDYAYGVDAKPTAFVPEAERATFQGFRRANGRVGTRNYIGILSSVNCSATVAKQIVARLERSGVFETYPNVDGAVALTHGAGCGMDPESEGFKNLQRLMFGYSGHPNFGMVVMVGLGCEVFQIASFKAAFGLEEGKTFLTLVMQETGGTRKTIEEGVRRIEEMLPHLNAAKRETVPASELCVALQCGGSDGYSGITANPAMGAAADLLVRHGGSAILAETPEIYGAEHLLTRRAASREIGEKLIERIRWWEDYTARNGSVMDNNPTPGNKAGGLTTILEKSLGAAAKGGTTNLNGVYKYAELIDAKGFLFMDSPGYDPASVTGEVASGANLVCFSTGRGSAFGYKPAPSVKLATNSAMFARLEEDMDVNCGQIVDGDKTVDAMGEEIFRLWLDVASGTQSKSEAFGYGDNEFVPWQIGAVM